MKKSLSLVFAALLFVALGCSFGGLGKKEEAPPKPSTDSTSTDTTSTDTTKAPDTTTDSKPTSTESGNLTIGNFNKVNLGDSYEDVVKALGGEGNETSSSSVGGSERKSYKWEAEKFVRVYANFRDNKLISKSQSGLGTESDGLTKAKYDKINTDMSYDAVKGVIGSDGAMTSLSKFGDTTLTRYRWKGAKYSSISVSFKNDKMTNKSQSNLK